MVKHVILWTLKDELSETEKEEVKKGIKEGLEGLKGVIPGLRDIVVNPAHVAVADGKVRPYTKTRSCLDFKI